MTDLFEHFKIESLLACVCVCVCVDACVYVCVCVVSYLPAQLVVSHGEHSQLIELAQFVRESTNQSDPPRISHVWFDDG